MAFSPGEEPLPLDSREGLRGLNLLIHLLPGPGTNDVQERRQVTQGGGHGVTFGIDRPR